MIHEIKCYLCDKTVCNADKPVKIICEACIDSLEKQEADLVKKYSIEKMKPANLKHFKHAFELPNYGVMR